MRRALVFCWLGLSLVGRFPVGPTGPGLSAQERHEVTVRLVLVDVIATGPDGRFVPGLKKEDFILFEDGRDIALNSCELFSFPVGQATPAEAVSPSPSVSPLRESHFIVIFDSVNTIRRMLEREKPRIIERLVGLIRLGQQIMVLELQEAGGLRLIQPFTRDERLVAAAVASASGSIWVEKAADALAVPHILTPPEPGLKPDDSGRFAKYEYYPREQYQYETRRRFEKTINSLLAALNTIKDLPGRKSVLFVSGGIPSISFGQFLSDKGDPVKDSIVIQSQVAAAKILDPFGSLRKSGFRSGQEILEDLIHFANSHSISFYALDPDNYLRYVLGDMAYDNFPRSAYTLSEIRKMGARKMDEVEELKKIELTALKVLAVDTAGEAFLGGDKFEQFREALARDLGQYYELSFAPRKKAADGRYHKIEVKVRRPGLDLRFRKGYTDYTDDQKDSLLLASASYNPELFTGTAFDAAVVPLVQGPGEITLWIQLALPVKGLISDAIEEDRPLRLKLHVTVNERSESAGLVSEVGIPFVLPAASLKNLGRAEFLGLSCGSQASRLKPGPYRIVIALLDEDGGRVSAAVRELKVPDWRSADRPRLVIGLLGNLIRQDKGPDAAEVPFTVSPADGALVLSAHRFQPMAAAKIKRGQPVALFVQLFSPVKNISRTPRLILLQNGRELAALTAEKIEDSWDKKTGIWNLVYGLDFPSLAGGDYNLKISFDFPKPQETVERDVPLRIL